LGKLLSYNSDAEGPGDCGSGGNIPEEADGLDVEVLLVAFMQGFQTWGLFLSCKSIRILEDQHSDEKNSIVNGEFKMKNTTKHQ
jgi:hypothetical protein